MAGISDWTEAQLRRFVANMFKAGPAGLPRSLKLEELEVTKRLVLHDRAEASPQAKVALRPSPDPSAAYAPTNVTPDRTFDANATTLDEIADVLGTLIADLKAAGLIS